MKTVTKILTSGLLTMGLVLTTFLVSMAQSNETNPSWTTSKEVQKVANKRLFNDENLRKSHIQASSVSNTAIISKGVHRKKGDDEVKGNVASTYPTWIISKDVQKIGRKK